MGELLGRAGPLSLLDEAVAQVADGPAPMVVVSGEPGIGKSRLLAEFTERAQAAGCTVLRGRAVEFEGDLPFAVLADALGSRLPREDDPYDMHRAVRELLAG